MFSFFLKTYNVATENQMGTMKINGSIVHMLWKFSKVSWKVVRRKTVTNVFYVNFQKLLHTLFLINIYLFNFTNIIGRAFCWMYLVSQTQKWYFADTTFFMHLTWEVLEVLNLAVKSNKWIHIEGKIHWQS